MDVTETMEKLADEISHAAEDLERTDAGHTAVARRLYRRSCGRPRHAN